MCLMALRLVVLSRTGYVGLREAHSCTFNAMNDRDCDFLGGD